MTGCCRVWVQVGAALLLLLLLLTCVWVNCRRDSPGVAAGLAHVALWNSAYLLSDDMARLIQARAQRRTPVFSKL